jgi:hypothetical protein
MIRALALLAALLLADITPRGDYFKPETAKLVATLQVGKAPAASFTFTRDARRLAVLTIDGTLALWDVSTRREIKQAPGRFFNSRILLSADGKRALGASPDRRSARLVDMESGLEIRTFPDVQAAYLQAYALSPDGQRVAVLRRDQSIRVCDAATGAELKTLIEPAAGQCGTMAWSPDGKTLAVHGWDSTVRLINAATGEIAGTFTDMGRTPLFLGFSPDSSTLVLVNLEARIRLIDRTGREIRVMEEALTGGRFIAFSPDGQLMAAADVGGKVRIWDTRTWRVLRDLDAGAIRHLAFSPDGRMLALGSVDGAIRLWGGRGIPAPKVEAPRPGAAGFLGIGGDTAEGEEGGVTITNVIAGTAAERAGLKEGDKIIRIGTSATDSFETLRTVVSSLREGDEVEVVFRRNGAENKVKLKLGSRPADE